MGFYALLKPLTSFGELIRGRFHPPTRTLDGSDRCLEWISGFREGRFTVGEFSPNAVGLLAGDWITGTLNRVHFPGVETLLQPTPLFAQVRSPLRIRSRAIGFVYSWSRLSAALSGLVVAFLLNLGGVNAVFAFIAFAMAIVVATIGGFGPRTRGLALEAIAH